MIDIPLQSLGIITPVAQDSLAELLAMLSRHDFRAFRLDGQRVCDEATFLAQATLDLPIPQAPKSWSSFTDGLWQGLHDRPESNVAIVWSHADRMLDGGLGDLLLAVDCLTDVACQVYDASRSGREIVLKVFLLGDGKNFPPLGQKATGTAGSENSPAR